MCSVNRHDIFQNAFDDEKWVCSTSVHIDTENSREISIRILSKEIQEGIFDELGIPLGALDELLCEL